VTIVVFLSAAEIKAKNLFHLRYKSACLKTYRCDVEAQLRVLVMNDNEKIIDSIYAL
jgi:hypothetical protein